MVSISRRGGTAVVQAQYGAALGSGGVVGKGRGGQGWAVDVRLRFWMWELKEMESQSGFLVEGTEGYKRRMRKGRGPVSSRSVS